MAEEDRSMSAFESQWRIGSHKSLPSELTATDPRYAGAVGGEANVPPHYERIAFRFRSPSA